MSKPWESSLTPCMYGAWHPFNGALSPCCCNPLRVNRLQTWHNRAQAPWTGQSTDIVRLRVVIPVYSSCPDWSDHCPRTISSGHTTHWHGMWLVIPLWHSVQLCASHVYLIQIVTLFPLTAHYYLTHPYTPLHSWSHMCTLWRNIHNLNLITNIIESHTWLPNNIEVISLSSPWGESPSRMTWEAISRVRSREKPC